MQLQDEVTKIKGVGPQRAKDLEKHGITTVRDLLYTLPSTYINLDDVTSVSELEEGKRAIVHGVVARDPRLVFVRNGLKIVTVELACEGGVVRIPLFNQPYLQKQYTKGKDLRFMGVAHKDGSYWRLDSARGFLHGGITPVYPKFAFIKPAMLERIIKEALNEVEVEERFSEEFCEKAGLISEMDSLRLAHIPKKPEDTAAARASLVLRELLVYSCMLREAGRRDEGAPQSFSDLGILGDFLSMLPFKPTEAQLRSMREIMQDMSEPYPMNRLLQGDVGSGKTIVAFFAAYLAMRSGIQTLFMAPTAILAEQHMRQAEKLFGNEAALLTAKTSAAERKRITSGLSKGDITLLIGTHALLYDTSEIPHLGLVITDEQHRFGVAQRAALSRGEAVNTLLMSATPIPRTLALIQYGKAQVSVIDELPPGRKPVKTRIVPSGKRKSMYLWLRDRLAQGAQAYAICPSIVSSEENNMMSIEQLSFELSSCMSGISVGVIHGGMSESAKSETMRSFAQGELSLLISTTVVEVGVDVPNASIIIIEDADRFGLATLHQLRGRVGRGERQSECYLVTSKPTERLEILKASNDGFEIAQKDLELRGAGELIGQRQSGNEYLRVASLLDDLALLEYSAELISCMPAEFPADYAVLCDEAKRELSLLGDKVVLN